MSVGKKNYHFLSYLFIQGIILIICDGVAYSQNYQAEDSINAQSEFSSNSDQNIISNRKSHDNFYKTDSIFSFRSPKGYFPSLIHNIGEQAIAPSHFKTKQWLMTGAAIGITYALVIVDSDIDEFARTQKQKHNWIKKSSPIITQAGGSYGVYSVLAIGSLSAVFKNEKGVQTSLLATQAMITSGIWVHLIKLITGRERPEADYIYSKTEGGKWYGPFAQFDQDLAQKKTGSSFDSFPSGHAATAFSIATVFALQYRDIKAIPVFCYSAATLVGMSRLTEHKHWASDVFVGSLLGYLCGRQVVANFNKTHQSSLIPMPLEPKNKTELTFIQYGNQIGLSLKW